MKKSAYRKIGHAYFAAVFLCLCLTAAACGFIVADNNTRAVQSGFADAVVAAAQQDKKLTLSVNEHELQLEMPPGFYSVSAILPCPVGNLFNLYADIREALSTFW